MDGLINIECIKCDAVGFYCNNAQQNIMQFAALR